MPIDSFATAAIETALNVLIKDSQEHGKQVLRLKGQVIQIHLIEADKTLTFVFSHQVDVLANYEGKPDCYVSLHVSALPELRDESNITRLIKQGKVEVEGDIKLVQSFSQLLKDIKPDIEEWLSRYAGDIAAHTLVQGAKNLSGWVKKQAAKHESHLGQVLTEEWRVAPPPLEVAFFCDQVADIKKAADKLDDKLNQLLEKA